ncbi:hypothetical protein Q1695_003322 [Nippostrongylus brasiliensis]|nr:hypothetical protein Q1695_003322 [Nippostrongylus brasiliensis]
MGIAVEEKFTPLQLSWRARTRGIVNVEPVLVMVALSLGLLATSSQLFMYWARCVQIVSGQGHDMENATAICSKLSGKDRVLQNLVEKDISSTRIFLQMSNTIPTLFMAPLIGTWSDKRGRKNPLLYVTFGLILLNVCQLMATITYERMNIYYWLFAGEILMGFCGSIGSFFGVTITIVTDDCRDKLKPGSSTVPLRIGVASFLQSIGSILGTLVMSLLAVPAISPSGSHQLSYVKAGMIQVTFALAGFIYAYLLVRETHFPLSDGYIYNRLNAAASVNPHPGDQPKSIARRVKEDMFALAEVLLQKRPGWTRCCLIMSLFFVFVEFLALDGSLLFLLVKREPFSWSDSMFSVFSLCKGLLFSTGMVLCPLLLTLVHWLGKDSLMIIVGIGASAVSFLMTSWASTTVEIFLASGLVLLCGGIGPGYRSFLPRMVPKEQTARLLTVCSIIIALCPMISTLMFNSIFNATIEWWAGFAFFVGGILQLVAFTGQSFVHILMRPQWLVEKRLKAQMTTHSLDVGEDNTGEAQRSTSTSSPQTQSDLNGESLEGERRNISV